MSVPTSFPTPRPTDNTSLIGEIGASIAVFVLAGVCIGAITDYVLSAIRFPIPYVAFVFLEGIAISRILKSVGSGDDIEAVESTNVASDLILYVFLPILLFGEVKNLNWHHLKGGFNQAFLLAGPGAFVSALITGACVQQIWPGWNQPVLYYVFGAILCATDPVSVVALLKTCGASSKLTIVIVGESLMNDGTAMILYFYFFSYVQGNPLLTATTIPQFFQFVAIKLFCSPAVGLAFGFLAIVFMKKLYDWNVTDIGFPIATTLICAYASFFFAEDEMFVGGSGVLSCCAAGTVLAWICSPKILNNHTMHHIWGNLEWVCNTLIFLLGGLIAGGRTISNASNRQYGYLVILFVLMNGIRIAMVVCLYPVLSRIGLKCSVNDSIFMAASGIRGALAIALALQLKSYSSVPEKDGEEFYFFVSGLATISLLINGTAAEPILKLLKLVDDPKAPKSQEMLFVLEQVKRRVRRQVRQEVEHMREEFGEFDNDEVRRLCTLMRSKDDNDHFQVSSRLDNTIYDDLLAYVRTTFLETVRARYWDSVMSGKIGTESFSAQLLLYSVDKGIDKVNDASTPLADWDSIERNLAVDKRILYLANTIDELFHRCGKITGCVNYIDTLTERRAIYVLTNFIDAHTFAQNHLHMCLGAPDKDSGMPIPEELSVMMDSELAVQKAKFLLSKIPISDLTKFYNHRAAKIVLLLQKRVIEDLVDSGSLPQKIADELFSAIGSDQENVDLERQSIHRTFLKTTMERKKLEEKEYRDSIRSENDGDRASFLSQREPSLRQSLSAVDRQSMTELNDSFMETSRHSLTTRVSGVVVPPNSLRIAGKSVKPSPAKPIEAASSYCPPADEAVVVSPLADEESKQEQ